MADREVPLLLADIVQPAREIAKYAAVGRDVFLGDCMRQRAVTQCFEVIGEATRKLPAPIRVQHSALPWRYTAAFRDTLIHDPFEVDPALMWTTASREIAAMLPLLEAIDMPIGNESKE